MESFWSSRYTVDFCISNRKHLQVTKRPSRSGVNSKQDDTDAVSFRFRRGSKDMFEELVDNNKEAVKDRKRKTEEESGKSSRSRSSGLPFNHFIDQILLTIYDAQARARWGRQGLIFCQYLRGGRARRRTSPSWFLPRQWNSVSRTAMTNCPMKHCD